MDETCAEAVCLNARLFVLPTSFGENLPIGFLQCDIDDFWTETAVRGLNAGTEGGIRLAEQELALLRIQGQRNSPRCVNGDSYIAVEVGNGVVVEVQRIVCLYCNQCSVRIAGLTSNLTVPGSRL